MLDLILSCLSPSGSAQVLTEKTYVCQRQAVHFAAICGQPCQFNVLMKHGTPCNEFDRSKQAPIHYLVERNNVLMVCTFLQTRMKALERIMATWLKAICAGKLQLGCAASSLHCIRFLPPGGPGSGIDQSNDDVTFSFYT
ncbi:hypothetical protein OSTOST_19106 [Ostertagia ostertagi]